MKYRLLALSGLAVSLGLGAGEGGSSASSTAASGPACASVPKSGAGSFSGMSTAPVATVTPAAMGSTYEVNAAHVVCGNVQTANATVYIIDTVLMPPAS